MLEWVQTELPSLLSTYGYTALAALVALEGIGLPVPGATVLIAASVYAGATDEMSLAGVIAAALGGAVVGDNIGYWLGRSAGWGLIARYGSYVRLNESNVKLGRYLFQQYGGTAIIVGRMVPVLRVLITFLAGAQRMGWQRFILFNIIGVMVWTTSFGGGGYLLGEQAHHLVGPLGLGAVVLGALGIGLAALLVRHHQRRLTAEAEAAFPEPVLEPPKLNR